METWNNARLSRQICLIETSDQTIKRLREWICVSIDLLITRQIDAQIDSSLNAIPDPEVNSAHLPSCWVCQHGIGVQIQSSSLILFLVLSHWYFHISQHTTHYVAASTHYLSTSTHELINTRKPMQTRSNMLLGSVSCPRLNCGKKLTHHARHLREVHGPLLYCPGCKRKVVRLTDAFKSHVKRCMEESHLVR